MLKDVAIHPSNPFQYTAELTINCMNSHKEFIILQADGGCNHNCTAWRNIIALLMIMRKLGLTYLIAMKNARGLSAHNPFERATGAVTFGLQYLALNRIEGHRELEAKLKECKGVKAFMEKHSDNKDLISSCNDTMKPVIDAVNEIISNV